MSTPSPKYFCPRCRAGYETDTNYCGRCGADMHRASGLDYARETGSSSTRLKLPGSESSRGADRRPPAGRRAADHLDPWLGRVVDQRYRVLEVIGRGGMGVVYKVEHQRMGKIAAMKVLHHDLINDPDVVRRFRREAETVSRLNHPNTVQVFDFGMARDALYLVMEYVRGLDVGSLIDRDGPMPFARAAPLFGQICAALAEAHELGVVHRDLKPENVLVTRTHGGHDFVKVLDFGLAKLSEREELAEVTGRGAIVGTPYYMSPEQIRGEAIDHRADLYSMGALMYRVLTGEPVFTAKTPVGVLTKHLTEPLVPPSRRCPGLGLDPRIDEIVGRCLRKQPGDRHPSAHALLADLEELYADLVDDASGPLRRAWFGGGRGGSQRGPSPTPRSIADAVDYGIEEELRLRRTDLDRFERSLKRRRLRVLILPLLLAAAAAAAGYQLVLAPPKPRASEAEPNDELADATLISAGTPVTGRIGRRISRSEPDRDFYRIAEVPAADGSQEVTVHVAALPNADMELYLYSADGRLLAHADEHGIGGDEFIRRYRVTRPIAVMVTEARRGGALPTENVSDHYTLTVRLGPVDPRWETEPNDNPSDATPLAPGLALSGHLDRRRDVDYLRFEGASGRYRVVISGADEVPLGWLVGDGRLREERAAEVELRPGSLLRLERRDRDLPLGTSLPGAASPYTVEVTRLE